MNNQQIDTAVRILTEAVLNKQATGMGEVCFALEGMRPRNPLAADGIGRTATEAAAHECCSEQAAPKSPHASHRERFMAACSAITPALSELYDQVEKVEKELADAKTFLASAWGILDRHAPPAGTNSTNPVYADLAVLCTQISKSGLQPNK